MSKRKASTGSTLGEKTASLKKIAKHQSQEKAKISIALPSPSPAPSVVASKTASSSNKISGSGNAAKESAKVEGKGKKLKKIMDTSKSVVSKSSDNVSSNNKSNSKSNSTLVIQADAKNGNGSKKSSTSTVAAGDKENNSNNKYNKNKLDQALVEKAVRALFAFQSKRDGDRPKAALIEDFAKPLILQISLRKNNTAPVLKPVRVQIPHSLFSPEEQEHSICLFCRSEDKPALETFLQHNPIPGLTKVVSINDVRKFYTRFKDRKQLLSEHTHFLCDNRVVRQLYNLLGNVFSARNDYPVPIAILPPSYKDPLTSSGKKDSGEKSAAAAAVFDRFMRSRLLDQVKKVVDSTYMYLNGGSQKVNKTLGAGHTISIRFGHLGMPVQHVVANILQGMEYVIEGRVPTAGSEKGAELSEKTTGKSQSVPVNRRFKGGWKDVHSVHIKLPDSAALPLYSVTAEEVVDFLKKGGGKGEKSKPDTLTSHTASAAVTTAAAANSIPTGGKKREGKEEKMKKVKETTKSEDKKTGELPTSSGNIKKPMDKVSTTTKAAAVAIAVAGADVSRATDGKKRRSSMSALPRSDKGDKLAKSASDEVKTRRVSVESGPSIAAKLPKSAKKAAKDKQA